eukprot:scaffold717_cov206-Skeletonema_marinoi.AAC.1
MSARCHVEEAEDDNNIDDEQRELKGERQSPCGHFGTRVLVGSCFRTAAKPLLKKQIDTTAARCHHNRYSAP